MTEERIDFSPEDIDAGMAQARPVQRQSGDAPYPQTPRPPESIPSGGVGVCGSAGSAGSGGSGGMGHNGEGIEIDFIGRIAHDFAPIPGGKADSGLWGFAGAVLSASQDEAFAEEAFAVWWETHKAILAKPHTYADRSTRPPLEYDEVRGEYKRIWRRRRSGEAVDPFLEACQLAEERMSDDEHHRYQRSPEVHRLYHVCRALHEHQLRLAKAEDGLPPIFSLSEYQAARVRERILPSGKPDHKAGKRALRVMVEDVVIRNVQSGTPRRPVGGRATRWIWVEGLTREEADTLAERVRGQLQTG